MASKHIHNNIDVTDADCNHTAHHSEISALKHTFFLNENASPEPQERATFGAYIFLEGLKQLMKINIQKITQSR